MAPKTVAPYGTWESPITAKMLASEDIVLHQIASDNAPKTPTESDSPDKIYYIESRPAEQGRRCIVECTFPANDVPQMRDVLPQEYSASTSVHGYGGGAIACQYNGRLVFSDRKTNGVYSLDPRTKQVECIIPGDEKIFFASFNARDDISQRWILALCENHHGQSVDNSIVAVDIASRTVHTVVSGADFYTNPQLYAAAERPAMICWTQWNHPDMPWTGSQLFVATWNGGKPESGEAPEVGTPTYIAGEPGRESIAQPKWNYEDGSLLFCSDRSGYWQLYCLEAGHTKPDLVVLPGLENGNLAGAEFRLGR